MTLLHDHPSIVMNWQFVFESSLLKCSQDISNLKLRGSSSLASSLLVYPRIYLNLARVEIQRCRISNEQRIPALRELSLLSLYRGYRVQGSDHQRAVHSQGLFFTVGNSGTAAGRTSRSRIVSNSFFVNSKLFVHAGILKTFFLSLVIDSGSKTWDRPRWSPAFSSHSALHLSPEIVHH